LDLSVDLISRGKIGLSLKNPLLVASEFAGYGAELARLGDVGLLGGIVTAPVGRRPWPGAQQPRVSDVPAGLLLHTGDQNPGVRAVLRHHAGAWADLRAAVIVRVVGASPDACASVVRNMEGASGVSGFHFYTGPRGAPMSDIEAQIDVVAAMREQTILPLLVALPLGVSVEQAGWFIEEGADALVLCAPPMGADAARRGGLHGPALLPLVLAELGRLAGQVNVPLVARGGVQTCDDLVACLRAGAGAVQIGSAIARNPNAPWTILRELEEWAQGAGIESIGKVVGISR
jgi:dihydroorotate dehydrogenase (NAD+) catalytic subunit